MSWVADKAVLEALAWSWEPSTILLTKDNWFAKTISCLTVIVTFGTQKYSKLQTKAATTIGPLVMIPATWTIASAISVLPHEVLGHVRQSRIAGLWIHPWVGVLPMAILYTLMLFPIGLALGRFWLELQADRARWKFWLAEEWTATGTYVFEKVLERADRFCGHVCGSGYFWALFMCWGKPWFRKTAGALCRDFALLAKDPESLEAWVDHG